MQFDYEKLDVYGVSLQFVAAAETVARSATRGHADLADQLRRASTSILLNLAEGAGEFSPREKARFYRVSKRSATECAALLDIFRQLELIDATAHEDARAMLVRIAPMLLRLIRVSENSERPSA